MKADYQDFRYIEKISAGICENLRTNYIFRRQSC
jgi:hypothetical protein